jgi:hypothetical protein
LHDLTASLDKRRGAALGVRRPHARGPGLKPTWRGTNAAQRGGSVPQDRRHTAQASVR